MTTAQENMRSDGWLRSLPIPFVSREDWPTAAQERLNRAYDLALRVPFDDDSRFIFFSDCHRGDAGPTDAFAKNRPLFLHALNHYYDHGYSYVEVGDGDELWQTSGLAAVQRAHAPVFDLLHRFHAHGRLHLVIGNHDSEQGMFDPMEKDGMPVHAAVVFKHVKSGQKLFAVHGHQVDPDGDRHWWLNRLQARYVWRHMLRLGFDTWHYVTTPHPGLPDRQQLERLPLWLSERILVQPRRLEQRVREWVATQRQAVICGHTHLLAFPRPRRLPYFNTGSCINPGYITGLEIADGRATLVKWTAGGNGYGRQTLRSAELTAYQ